MTTQENLLYINVIHTTRVHVKINKKNVRLINGNEMKMKNSKTLNITQAFMFYELMKYCVRRWQSMWKMAINIQLIIVNI